MNSTISMKYFTVAWPDSGTRFSIAELKNTNSGVFIQCQHTRTILRKKNMGQSLFKAHSKFLNFDEIFYCGMTRPRNTNLDNFIQCQYTRTILREKKMWRSLIKKHSKFLNFDEIFHCDMARLRNTIFNCCCLRRYVKAIKLKKYVKNHLKCQNFNIQ